MPTTREDSLNEVAVEAQAEPKKRVVRRRTVKTEAESSEAAPVKKPRAVRTRKVKAETRHLCRLCVGWGAWKKHCGRGEAALFLGDGRTGCRTLV